MDPSVSACPDDHAARGWALKQRVPREAEKQKGDLTRLPLIVAVQCTLLPGSTQGHVLTFTVVLEGSLLITSAEIHLFYSPIKFCMQW